MMVKVMNLFSALFVTCFFNTKLAMIMFVCVCRFGCVACSIIQSASSADACFENISISFSLLQIVLLTTQFIATQRVASAPRCRSVRKVHCHYVHTYICMYQQFHSSMCFKGCKSFYLTHQIAFWQCHKYNVIEIMSKVSCRHIIKIQNLEY